MGIWRRVLGLRFLDLDLALGFGLRVLGFGLGFRVSGFGFGFWV